MNRPNRLGCVSVLGLSVLVVIGSAGAARAEMPAGGFSVEAGFSTFQDRTVMREVAGTSYDLTPYRDRSSALMLTVLGNVGLVSLGANLEGTPGVFGDGRLLVGGLVGVQPVLGRARFQLMAEGGTHRYTDVAGGLFSNSSTPEVVTTPYAGGRIGVATTLPGAGGFQIGGWLFARHDFESHTVSHTLCCHQGAEYLRVGGKMVGVALRLGWRVDLGG